MYFYYKMYTICKLFYNIYTVPTGYVFTIVYSPSPTYPMKKEKRSRGIPQLLFL